MTDTLNLEPAVRKISRRSLMASAGGFDYEFEELPLVVENGIEAGLVNGSAEIVYYTSGEWFIHDIRLEAYKDGKRTTLKLEEQSWLYLTIYDALDSPGRRNDRIADKVLEELSWG